MNTFRVLHIEDDTRVVDTVRESLRGVGSVEAVGSLAATVALLNQGPVIPYDVILIDLILPDASDIQAITALARYRIPMIILSGLGNPDLLARAAAAGADDFIVKPNLRRADLVERIRFVCERAKAAKPTKLCKRMKREAFDSVKPFITYNGTKSPFAMA